MKRVSAAIAVVAVLAAGCGGEKAEEPATVTAPSSSAVEKSPTQAAPESAKVPQVLQAKGTTVDGKPYDLASLAGKPVVLWFWAPWCPKCISEGPAVAKAAQKYDGKVAFVGIGGLDKSKDELQKFITRTGTTGIVQMDDRTGALYKHFKVTEQSSYVFVNPEGGTNSAVGPLSEGDLADLIEQHAM